MPGYTYCYDHEVRNWESVPDDKELNELLQAVRNTISENWYLQVRTHKPRKRWWERQARPEYKSYTLYWYTGAGIEYQVINFATEHGTGSVFSYANRSCVANFLMGLLNGWDDHKRRQPPVAAGVPEGYVVVPVKATSEMIQAWTAWVRQHGREPQCWEAHEIMLKARPEVKLVPPANPVDLTGALQG